MWTHIDMKQARVNAPCPLYTPQDWQLSTGSTTSSTATHGQAGTDWKRVLNAEIEKKLMRILESIEAKCMK